MRNYIPWRGARQLFSPSPDSKPENNGKESQRCCDNDSAQSRARGGGGIFGWWSCVLRGRSGERGACRRRCRSNSGDSGGTRCWGRYWCRRGCGCWRRRCGCGGRWCGCGRCQAGTGGGIRVIHKVAGLVGIQASGLALQGMACSHILARRQHYGVVITVGEGIDNSCRAVLKDEAVSIIA